MGTVEIKGALCGKTQSIHIALLNLPQTLPLPTHAICGAALASVLDEICMLRVF
jgi:hypothetical protein